MDTATAERNLFKELDAILLTGEENSITGEVLKNELGLKDTRPARLAMVEMRHKDIPVIGGPKGYCKAKNLEEIMAAKERLKKNIIALCIDLRDLKRIGNKYAGQTSMKL